MSRVDRLAPALFTSFAAVFVLMVVYKTLASFDGIPYWDTYDGSLAFYSRFLQGDWLAVWDTHNEHRIVLTRLLFLVDLNLLDGTTPFLLYLNLVLAGFVALILLAFLREVPKGRSVSWLPAFIVAVSFSELQYENLHWSFQSQFFLAYILPLAALYFSLLSLSRPERSRSYFATSTCLGVLSIGTMANGVFTLPILTVYGILTRMSWQRVALLVEFSIVGLAVYLHGLPDKADAPSGLQVLGEEPLRFFGYVMTYLGGPFGTTGIVLAAFSGIVLVVLALNAAWKHIPRGRASAVEIALLCFMGYIFLTALVTAIGRVSFGMGQAMSSRYTTPNIMNWCLLLMLYLPWIVSTPKRVSTVTRAFLVLILLLFFVQLSAIRPDRKAIERMGAALALELGIPDQYQVSYVYPKADHALQIVDELRGDPKAIFAMEPIKEVESLIGAKTSAAISFCEDPELRATPVPNTTWTRINGPVLQIQSKRLLLSNETGLIVGIAIQGRTDTIGYLNVAPIGPLYIGNEVSRCGPVTVH